MKVDESMVTYEICGCGCGCEPDGDWHFTEPIGCRCASLGCPCVTDALGRPVGSQMS